VVLYGHSFGGMLARSYLERHPQRVARVLTAGTPYFGSAKPLLPLLTGRESAAGTTAFGIDLPLDQSLDILLRDKAFADLARNLEGMYQLYPSDKHVKDWLFVGGRPLSAPQRGAFIAEHGGNLSMLNAAGSEHRRVWDVFWNANGVIDYRALGGAGLPTVRRLDLLISGKEARISLVYGNGDGTVLLDSQLQGARASITRVSARDKMPTQVVCGVPHLELSGNRDVNRTYLEFLTLGAIPERYNTPSCLNSTFPTQTFTLPLRSLGR